jgi:hypothetical protein
VAKLPNWGFGLSLSIGAGGCRGWLAGLIVTASAHFPHSLNSPRHIGGTSVFPRFGRSPTDRRHQESPIALRLRPGFGRRLGHFLKMNNKTNKTTEAQLLDLLKKVLPKATKDAQLAGKIYQAIEEELKAKARSAAFDKFCAKVELPNLDPKSLEEVKTQLAATFDDGDLVLKPNRKEKTVAVEVSLPDGTQLNGEIKVNPNASAEAEDEQEFKPTFVPFPVCMPGDKELVWLLGKYENLSPEEAGIALTKAEDEFWASKNGQKLLRDRIERSFPEFIARVPSAMLSELGLKRHYKTPEPIKSLRPSKRN